MRAPTCIHNVSHDPGTDLFIETLERILEARTVFLSHQSFIPHLETPMSR
jgi:hypothetical protein